MYLNTQMLFQLYIAFYSFKLWESKYHLFETSFTIQRLPLNLKIWFSTLVVNYSIVILRV